MAPLFDQYSKTPFNAEWFLCHYIPGHNDFLSERIIEFKNGDRHVLNIFSNWMISEIRWLNEQGVWFDCCCRVLGSSETSAETDKPLDDLTHNVSWDLDIPFYRDLLFKKRPTTKFSTLNRDERIREINGVYAVNPDFDLTGQRLLLIDDIRTSGTSSNTICNSLQAKFDDTRIYLFTLGQTNRNIGNNGQDREEMYLDFEKKVNDNYLKFTAENTDDLPF